MIEYRSTDHLGDRFKTAAKMLLAGVAFQNDRRTWHVFSHDGDQLGTLSTFIVGAAARELKLLGYTNDGLRDCGGHPTTYHAEGFRLQCLSFGRKVNWPAGVLEEMMERLAREPQTIL
jgi:hypothetical protein